MPGVPHHYSASPKDSLGSQACCVAGSGLGLATFAFIVLTAASVNIPPLNCDADECRSESNCNASAVHDDPNADVFHDVCLDAGTEPAGSGRYDDTSYYDREGVYRCSCCGHELFSSSEKFNSGTGWPSFWAPLSDNSLSYSGDGLLYTEVSCGECGAHLGHVFDDGPSSSSSGLRYCINSVCLDFAEGVQESYDGHSLPPVFNPLLNIVLGWLCSCGAVLVLKLGQNVWQYYMWHKHVHVCAGNTATQNRAQCCINSGEEVLGARAGHELMGKVKQSNV